MSRAFVKEPDGDQADDDLPERPQSEHPNYITPVGLEALQSRAESLRARQRELAAAGDELSAKTELKSVRAELRWLDKRIQSAIPVDTASADRDSVRFGATVRLLDAQGASHAFTIVGEDEMDVARGRISWVSPLGRELLNRRAGDVVRWQRPAGDLELEIESFHYPQ